MGALSLQYQIEYGGAFLKDAAALAGLGVIGKNNLLVTPRYGPRLRLRGIFMEAELEPTGPLTDFAPCVGCDRPCHRACPKGAFRSGKFERALCKQEQDQRDVDFEVMDGSILGVDGACNVTAYCRACELACPVAREKEAAGAAESVVGHVVMPAASRPAAEAPAEQTHFVLTEDTWAAFLGQLGGKSQVIPALAEAAGKPGPFDGADARLRLEALAETHDVAGFACGESALDDYLARRAHAERSTGKTRVATDGRRVAAYFTLKAATVSPPATVQHQPGQAPLDVPAILLARLAVDGAEQGRGLGEAMLVQALRRCLQAADTMFARAVLAAAPVATARSFYEKYGFVPSATDPQHLVMRMKDIRKSLTPPQE
jgi:GNAT superfamily N-acetyltransferase